MSSVLTSMMAVFSYILAGYILKKINIIPANIEKLFSQNFPNLRKLTTLSALHPTSESVWDQSRFGSVDKPKSASASERAE